MNCYACDTSKANKVAINIRTNFNGKGLQNARGGDRVGTEDLSRKILCGNFSKELKDVRVTTQEEVKTYFFELNIGFKVPSSDIRSFCNIININLKSLEGLR